MDDGLLFGAGVGCGAKAWGKDLEGSGLYNKAYYTRIKGLGCSRTIFQMSPFVGFEAQVALYKC